MAPANAFIELPRNAIKSTKKATEKKINIFVCIYVYLECAAGGDDMDAP